MTNRPPTQYELQKLAMLIASNKAEMDAVRGGHAEGKTDIRRALKLKRTINQQIRLQRDLEKRGARFTPPPADGVEGVQDEK